MSTRNIAALALFLLVCAAVPLLAAASPSAPAPATACAGAAGPDALAAVFSVAAPVVAPLAPVTPLDSPLAGAQAAATCTCSDDDCFATCGPCGGTVWSCRALFNGHCAAICFCRVC